MKHATIRYLLALLVALIIGLLTYAALQVDKPKGRDARGKAPATNTAPAGEPQITPKPAQLSVAAERGQVIHASTPQTRLHASTPQVGWPTGYVSPPSRDRFAQFTANEFIPVSAAPVSTFSVDVDTASYAFVRRVLGTGQLPAVAAVRVEEMINYFDYTYPKPSNPNQPVAIQTDVMPTPWNANTKLLRIGLQGYSYPPAKRPPVDLVFLIDTSGSMNSADKLPLLKASFRLLSSVLQPQDRIALVTYAGSAGVVLEPTSATDQATIEAALSGLSAGGSTAGGAGLRLAYAVAARSLGEGERVRRVILATDGDFNVGLSSDAELKSYISQERKRGISLSVLGFGQGNLQDNLMQTLAQNGNGNAAYIDSIHEARKVLVQEASGTLFTIAKDVKIQVEFNPQQVSEYRLIGYETRALKREDFKDDRKDAGEIGSGHQVTALYEFTPAGTTRAPVEPLRYATEPPPSAQQSSSPVDNEYAFVRVRYKLPNATRSSEIVQAVSKSHEVENMSELDADARFAVAVAAFGQLLAQSPYVADYSYAEVLSLARGARGPDEHGYRAEFIRLVEAAADAAQP